MQNILSNHNFQKGILVGLLVSSLAFSFFNFSPKINASKNKEVETTVDVENASEGVAKLTVELENGDISTGSAVVIREDGYLLTNYHVVNGSDFIHVNLNSNEEFKGKLIGFDPSTDLAIVKIDSKNLTTLPIANSENLKVGQKVFAIGSPFGLQNTVTAGILSAKNRNATFLKANATELSIENFLQTDAPVNSGNSGGAMINDKGQLIGIITAIASESGKSEGYSFAIPSNLAKKVADDIINFGKVQRGFMGIGMADAEKDFKNKPIKGALVANLEKNGSAALAGMKEGDIITHVGESSVLNTSHTMQRIAEYRPGQEVEVKVTRGSKRLNFKVKLKN